MPDTKDILTDDDIRALWRKGAITAELRDCAIRTYPGGMGEAWRAEARARCLMLVNAANAARAS
jgi:hypothetical protein